MSVITNLINKAVEAAGLKSKFETQSGKGALFAYADNTTGEVARIEGNFRTPAPTNLLLNLDGKPHTDGMITLIGTVEGQPEGKVEGFLKPHTYPVSAARKLELALGLVTEDQDAVDPAYKKGEITVTGANGNSLTWKINSKVLISKTSGEPYRFIWFHHDQTRIAF